MGLLGLFDPSIEKLEENKDIHRLIRALRSKKKPSIQRLAAEALGRLGDAQAVEPLIMVLRDESKAARLSEAKFENFEDILETFETQFESIFPFARKSAAWALGEIGDAKAIKPLEELAQNDPESRIRQAAKEALAKIRGKD